MKFMTRTLQADSAGAEGRYARGFSGLPGVLGMIMMLSAPHARGDTVNTEALGVVNGSITARSQMTEIKPFLSGRPLFRYDAREEEPPLMTLLIEGAGGELRDGLVWMQQSLALSCTEASGQRGGFQLPLQVEVAGQPVTVAVREGARGLLLTLPEPGRQVRIRPAGPVNLVVPVTCRGDIRADIRITGDTSDAGT